MVNNLFTMLGDVGGVYDFLILAFSPLLGLLSRCFMTSAMIQKLFHAALDSESPNSSPKENLAAIRPLSFSRIFTLFAKCKSNGMRHQALELGKRRIDKALDIVQLVRQARAIKTLQRLLLSKDERRLLKF